MRTTVFLLLCVGLAGAANLRRTDAPGDKGDISVEAQATLDAQNAEAHASLSKLLFDQGKTSLAEKAMAKATKLNNDKAAQWELF